MTGKVIIIHHSLDVKLCDPMVEGDLLNHSLSIGWASYKANYKAPCYTISLTVSLMCMFAFKIRNI